jgi:peptidyl-prolyl isomerase G (cyclophilin G)
MLGVFSILIPGVDENSTTSQTEKATSKPRKKRKHREATAEDLESPPAHIDKKETEEEYDARLEREETERQEQDRKQILLHIKKTYSEEPQSTGVRYKGKYSALSRARFHF